MLSDARWHLGSRGSTYTRSRDLRELDSKRPDLVHGFPDGRFESHELESTLSDLSRGVGLLDGLHLLDCDLPLGKDQGP